MDMAIMLHDGLCGPTRHRSAMSILHDTTRLVGVCAFSGSLRGFRLVPSKRRHLVPPTSGYPSKMRWDGPPAVGRQVTFSFNRRKKWIQCQKLSLRKAAMLVLPTKYLGRVRWTWCMPQV